MIFETCASLKTFETCESCLEPSSMATEEDACPLPILNQSEQTLPPPVVQTLPPARARVIQPAPRVPRHDYPHIPPLESPHEIKYGVKATVARGVAIEVPPPPPPPARCPHCNYTGALRHLERHIGTHFDDKPFRCPHCEYCAKRKDRLKEHIRQHVEPKRFKCTYCDFSSNYKASIEYHLRRHTGEKPWKCLTCDKRLSSKQSVGRFHCNATMTTRSASLLSLTRVVRKIQTRL